MRVLRAAAVAMAAAGMLAGAVAARAEDPQPSPSPPPSPPPAQTTSVLANLPIRLYANVNLRQGFQRSEDKADRLLDPNPRGGIDPATGSSPP